MAAPGTGRNFLFLQGPHGPFFLQLARALREKGARCWRIGFNAGDRFFWRDPAGYIAFDAPECSWPAFLDRLVEQHRISDLVLYGDTRPRHVRAAEVARRRGLTLHVFEEGYLRPWWITYERGGSNGNSRLMRIPLAQMRSILAGSPDQPAPAAPDHWGALRHHMFYGALYHWLVWFANRRYPHYRSHRDIPVSTEFRLNLRRLLLLPLHGLQRSLATRKARRSGYPYHLVLLQLAHDANFRTHSPFADMEGFLEAVIRGFAQGAPENHRLVFKAHPLEDGRVPLRRMIRRLARRHGLQKRVQLVPGGRLAALMDGASSAITVNSTAGQQALWRGLPLLAFGAAVYSKPELVSAPPAEKFFRAPPAPDHAAYLDYRRFLLATSQIPGSYYTARGRRQLLPRVTGMMLDPRDPYDAFAAASATKAQQSKVAE